MSGAPAGRAVVAGTAGAAGVAACGLGLLAAAPVVHLLAAVAALAVVAAVVTGLRWLGDLTVGLVTTTVLLAGATDAAAVGPGRLFAAAALLLVLVTGLDRLERPNRWGRWARAEQLPTPQAFPTAPAGRRWGVPLLAVAAAAGVAVTAAQPVVPSAWLVLLGLAAAVGALLVASRQR
ncbi:MAG: hypothetical protein ACXVXG_16740 [Nocardioidaceae bacterium]